MKSFMMLILDITAALLSRLGGKARAQSQRSLSSASPCPRSAPYLSRLSPRQSSCCCALPSFAWTPRALRVYLERPAIVLVATAWTSLVIPALFGSSCLAFGLNDQSPDLFLALMLQGVASPMMASPALAALMGLDATLVLVTLVTSTALIPFTAPLFAHVFIGTRAHTLPIGTGAQVVRDPRGLRSGRLHLAPDLRPGCHRAAEGEDRRLQHSGPLRLRGGRHGERRRSLSRRADGHNWPCRPCLRGVLRGACPDHPPLLVRRPGAGPCARIHGLPTQHGADAGGDRRGPARPRLAIFRPLPVSHLPVAKAAPAAGATDTFPSTDC